MKSKCYFLFELPGYVFKSSNQGLNTLSKSNKRKSSEGTNPPSKKSNSTVSCSTPRPEARPVPKPALQDEVEADEPSTFEKLQSIESMLQDLRERRSDSAGELFMIFSLSMRIFNHYFFQL